MSKIVNIVLADSQYLTSAGLRYLLSKNKNINVIGIASNRNELLDLIEFDKPDIVILDYYNQEDAFSLDDIKATTDKTKVLIISSDKNKNSIYEVLSYGIYGFLTKRCKEEEVTEAIESIQSGKRFFCQSVLDLIVEKQMADKKIEQSTLTPREIDILKLIAKGYTTKEIASEIYLSPHTVNTHRKNMMKKLGVNSATELLIYAINEGLLSF